MQIKENIHLIRKDFYVTPQVKRFVNMYLIEGKDCYLVDSGVVGSEHIIEEYMQSIGRKITDIKGIFITHAHPDHIGSAYELKQLTNCKIYAPYSELGWIEDIDVQFNQRPIPNFYNLVSHSVKVDMPLCDGDVIVLEDNIQIAVVETRGHSHGSISFVLNDEVIFTGDAIPLSNDLPIFVDYAQSLNTLDRISEMVNIQLCCSAWDDVYDKRKLEKEISVAKKMLDKLRETVNHVEVEYGQCSEQEKLQKIFELSDMLLYVGNPLVIRSIEACKEYNMKTEGIV